MYKSIIDLKISLITTILFLALVSVAFLLWNGSVKGKIVCFGDSITFGASVEGNGWVEQLTGKSDSIQTINSGRKGRKTSDKNELIPVLEKNMDVDYFLFLLGVNDLKDGNDSLVSVCSDNMKWMIDRVKEKVPKAKIVLISPCRINMENMSEVNRQKKYNENTTVSLIKLDKSYKTLAERESVGFISLLQTVSQQNFIDGLHPNLEGHKEIAEKIWAELNKIYCP